MYTYIENYKYETITNFILNPLKKKSYLRAWLWLLWPTEDVCFFNIFFYFLQLIFNNNNTIRESLH